MTTQVVFFTGILLSFAVHSSAQEAERLTPQDIALIAVARAAVRNAVTGVSATRTTDDLTHLPAQAVFVTIERKGSVVGCRGTLHPHTASLVAEVMSAARSAATTDPRYRPLTSADLSQFLVTVTIIERLEPIDRVAARSIGPADGLALEAGGKIGVVLPWEGRDPATLLHWGYRKAGISEDTPCTLWRVVARRFRG